MVADALVDAAIKGEMAALREVFQRIDGKTAEGPSGGEASGPVELEIRWLTEAEEMPGARRRRGKASTLKNPSSLRPRLAFKPYHPGRSAGRSWSATGGRAKPWPRSTI